MPSLLTDLILWLSNVVVKSEDLWKKIQWVARVFENLKIFWRLIEKGDSEISTNNVLFSFAIFLPCLGASVAFRKLMSSKETVRTGVK